MPSKAEPVELKRTRACVVVMPCDVLANVTVVNDEVTVGIAPRAALVAVTMHVPGRLALSTAPLSVHFEVPAE